MIDGVYNVQVSGAIGNKSAKVGLRTEGDTVAIDLDAPMLGKRQAQGALNGNAFTASGVYKIPLLGKIEYDMEGEVEGDELRATIHTSKGDLNIVGSRA